MRTVYTFNVRSVVTVSVPFVNFAGIVWVPAVVGLPEIRHPFERAIPFDELAVQVMPAVAHASMASGYLIADDAVWCETVIAGGTYTDPETVTATALRFDTLRAECYRASESLALIERLESQWATGARRPTRQVTAASA